jgi:hypothetical protein
MGCVEAALWLVVALGLPGMVGGYFAGRYAGESGLPWWFGLLVIGAVAIVAAELGAYGMRWGGGGDSSVGASIRLAFAEAAFWWNVVATTVTTLIGFGLGRSEQEPTSSIRI